MSTIIAVISGRPNHNTTGVYVLSDFCHVLKKLVKVRKRCNARRKSIVYEGKSITLNKGKIYLVVLRDLQIYDSTTHVPVYRKFIYMQMHDRCFAPGCHSNYLYL